jgi:GT2 family glycosyltransferase
MAINSNPRVTCVVLNWNGWKDTVACLDALKKCTYPELTVLAVDNGSSDDSVDRIRAAHPSITLLETGANLGFAGGNNVGVRHALAQGADYLWLLNNDTEPAPDALSALVAKVLTNPRIGAAASICYYADSPNTVQIWAGGRVNLWIGYSPYTTEPHDDDWFHWLNGTSLLIASRALENAGLLDERFFLYWEDTELCLRLRKHGWCLAAAPDSRVLHKVSASTGGNKVILDRHATASGLRTLRLYSSMPHVAMFLFVAIRFARRIAKFEFSQCLSVVEGIRAYLRTPPVSSKFS